MGSKTRIYDLPDEILAEILQRVAKRKDVALVCKRWYEVDRVVTRSLHFDHRTAGHMRILPKQSVIALTSRFFNLTTFSISYKVAGTDPRMEADVQVDDDSMRCLSVGCVNLTTLSLAACDNVTDVGMANIALCPKLTTVRLKRMSCLSEIGLYSLLTGCRSLKALAIRLLKNVRAGDWMHIIGTHCHIESLRIDYCDGIEEFELARLGHRGWSNLRRFIYYGPRIGEREGQPGDWALTGPQDTNVRWNLEQLVLRNCLSTSKTGLLSILGHCTALRKVQLEECAGMRDEDICVLARRNPLTSSLALRINCALPTPNLTNIGLLQVAKFFCGLRILHLSYWRGRFQPQILESGIIAIMESCTQLYWLWLSNVPCLRAGAMAAISRLKFLRSLSICRCDHLEDAMIFPVGPKLERYELSTCPLLTNECLNNLRIPEGSSLKLTIIRCPRITQEAALQAAADVFYAPGLVNA